MYTLYVYTYKVYVNWLYENSKSKKEMLDRKSSKIKIVS